MATTRTALWVGAAVFALGAAATFWGAPRLLELASGRDGQALLSRGLPAVGLATALLLAVTVWAWLRTRVAVADAEDADEEREAAEDQTQRALRKLRRDRATFERRLAERTRAMEAKIDEQVAFGDSVSHDLRSPLGNIVLCAEILGDDHRPRLDAEGSDLVRRIDSSARTALALLERLIAFSRVGRAALQTAPVDMRELAASIFAELMLGHEGPRPRLVLGPLPTVSGDEAMLRIVWTNLLGNAMKFSRTRERPVIKVGVRQGTHKDTFWVEDNGVGFLPSQGAKLFKTFQRLHRADGFEGHGLGLAIVRRIIERHGGRVWARGEPDRGAVLGFELPTHPRNITRRAARRDVTRAAGPVAPSRNGRVRDPATEASS